MMGVKEEKTADLHLYLKTDTKFVSTVKTRISVRQWVDIDKVLNGELKTDLVTNKRTCRIINGQFSWTMEVDGETITFSGRSSAEYFQVLYEKIGYKVEFIDQK
jgi:hypothetical protein